MQNYRSTIVATCIAALALAATSAQATAGQAAATANAALASSAVSWQMNEDKDAKVMIDSGGGGGLHGVIGDEVLPGNVSTDEQGNPVTAYLFTKVSPNTYPPTAERLVVVDDNDALDPDSGVFTVEIRYRTTHNHGNMIQKGQAKAKGGQWKFQQPKGKITCLFKGPDGRATASSRTPLNDGLWHVVRCVRTSTSVTMYVDGEYRSRKNGLTGTINNKVPLTIGGKINCDQDTVTCDYFSGEIDYVTISKG